MTRKQKLHYFNGNDDRCVIKNPFRDCYYKRTYCGRDPTHIRLHTDNKSEVTCLVCLSMVNHYQEMEDRKIL